MFLWAILTFEDLWLQGWPVKKPDIVVSTPVALLNYLYDADRERNRQFNFLRGVKYVVS